MGIGSGTAETRHRLQVATSMDFSGRQLWIRAQFPHDGHKSNFLVNIFTGRPLRDVSRRHKEFFRNNFRGRLKNASAMMNEPGPSQLPPPARSRADAWW